MPFRVALLKLSSQEATQHMALGQYEDALPIAMDAIKEGQDLFKPQPDLRLFPLFLLGAQVPHSEASYRYDSKPLMYQAECQGGSAGSPLEDSGAFMTSIVHPVQPVCRTCCMLGNCPSCLHLRGSSVVLSWQFISKHQDAALGEGDRVNFGTCSQLLDLQGLWFCRPTLA